MAQKIKYTSEYQIECNKLSIDLLKSLNEFLNKQNLFCQNERQRISFECDNFELKETFFENLLNNKNFIASINKNFSLIIIVLNEDLSHFFSLHLERKNSEIKIFGSIKDADEHTVVGYKEVLEKFLKDNFIEEKVIEQEINDNNNQAENIIANKTLVKKTLEWNIPSVKLTLEDLTEIEFLLKQDLANIQAYKINVEPNEKYLQKRTNAPKYTFNSAKEFKNYNDLLKNIKNYSIEYRLRTAELYIYFKFSNECNYLNKLYANGENQTLYYGKYKLLTDYLNTKKNWYYWMYYENFRFYICPIIFLFVTLFISMIFCKSIAETLWIKSSKIFLFYVIFLVLFFNTTNVFKKYNFSFIKEKFFAKSKLFEILYTLALAVLANIITPYFQDLKNIILKLINK